MKFVYGNRASSVLFNWLKSNNISGRALIPANICESVPATYLKAGLDIIFCDIDFEAFQPNMISIKEILSTYQDISVFHYNHTYGCRNGISNDVLTYIKQYYPNIIMIDDCCLSIPRFNHFNSIFDMVLFSTGHTKVVNIGKGGFAFYQEKWVYREFFEKFSLDDKEKFEKHVRDCHLDFSHVNTNIMMSQWLDTVCEFNGRDYLDEVKDKFIVSTIHKNKLNTIYDAYLSDFSLGKNYQDWRYNILVDNQDCCLKLLFENGLFASKHYKSLGSGYFVNDVFCNCDWLEDHVINLFNDFCYTEEQAEKTAKLLKCVAKPSNKHF